MPRVTQPDKSFRYRRRPADQWRTAAGPRPVGAEDAAWLAELLTMASRSVVLSDWECGFVLDLDSRLSEWGNRLILSDRQRAVLRRIAEKLGIA